MGTLMVSRDGEEGVVALNSVPSANFTALAVLPRNEPPMFNWASEPKIIPLGLSKNRLAVPLVRIKPLIFETDPPVTRPIMFSTSKALLKNAEPPVGTENSLKLWKRLPPARFPLLIVKLRLSGDVTVVDSVPSPVIC
jgi:hypothetical protein